MTIRWSPQALSDVDRLVDFLAARDLDAAAKIELDLAEAPKSLIAFPRMGSRLSQFDPREVREFRVGHYLLRYELKGRDILVLRFFHGREDRF